MVAIKGMEMPSCCYECPYGHCVGSFSFCSIIGDDEIDIQEDYLAGTRYEYCPLVEIEERKVGKWICVRHIENKITYDSWKCSECQHDFNSEEESMVDFDEYKFCPNCGADMRGSENG